MSEVHSIAQGEHLSQIARKYGFRSYLTIWNHPNNESLKKLRKDPNILYPGDSLFIPDREPKVVTRGTGMTHKFVAPIPKLELRIALRDLSDQPITGLACNLDVEGTVYPLTTDGNGTIRQAIAADAERGAVRAETLDMDLAIGIGYLDPVEEESGLRRRLANLGYDAGPLGFDDAGELRSAIEEFQCDHGLKVDGVSGSATREKLREVYGC